MHFELAHWSDETFLTFAFLLFWVQFQTILLRSALNVWKDPSFFVFYRHPHTRGLMFVELRFKNFSSTVFMNDIVLSTHGEFIAISKVCALFVYGIRYWRIHRWKHRYERWLLEETGRSVAFNCCQYMSFMRFIWRSHKRWVTPNPLSYTV